MSLTLWLVWAWVQIPFTAIFADIPQCWFKHMNFRLLFSNIIRRLSYLGKRAACLTVLIGYRTEARALMLACRVMWHVAFGFTLNLFKLPCWNTLLPHNPSPRTYRRNAWSTCSLLRITNTQIGLLSLPILHLETISWEWDAWLVYLSVLVPTHFAQVPTFYN